MNKISDYLQKLSNAKTSDSDQISKKEYISGIVLALLSAAIYGFMPMMARIFKSEGGDPILLAMFRFFFSSLFLLPLIKGSNSPFKIEKSNLLRLLLVALAYAITPPLLYMSYEYLDTGIATILHFSYPALVIILCLIFYKDKPKISAILCLLFSLIGITLIQIDPSKHTETLVHSAVASTSYSQVIGLGLAILSGLTYAIYVVFYSKSRLITIPLFTLAFYLNFFSFIILVPYRLLNGINISLSFKGILIGILLAFSCSVLATIFFQYACSKIGGAKAALLSTFEPLVSVIVASLFLNEKLSTFSALGVAAILLASCLLIFEKKQNVDKKNN